jgi:uncharacterized protein (TIGR02453 family)
MTPYMNKQYMFDFLSALSAHINSKEWMDANRARYHQAKTIWLEVVEAILQRLQKHDARLEMLQPRSCISRINNNIAFHPNRPIYKDKFTFSAPRLKNRPNIYLSVSPQGCFMGGGFWRPRKETLARLRSGFDYDGQTFLELMQDPNVMDFFGVLQPDDQQLKTAPQGYGVDHPYIELLKRKNFVFNRSLTKEEVLSERLVDLMEEGYLILQPILHHLEKLASFDPDA